MRRTNGHHGRITASSVESNESGASLPWAFSYDYSDSANGVIIRTGPDGLESVTELDDAGRVLPKALPISARSVRR